MIATQRAGVQPATSPENPYTATDFEADYLAAFGDGPRPSLRAEYAILQPDGLWWRELAERAADPDGEEPTVYGTRAAAFAALDDVIKMAETLFGPVGYRPTVVIRRVVDHAGSRAMACPWRGVEVAR